MSIAGLILALGIPMAWYLALFARSRFAGPLWTLANFCYPPAALLAILLTGSRGSLMATIPAGIFILTTATRSGAKTRAAVVLTCATAVFAIPFVVPDDLIERIGT